MHSSMPPLPQTTNAQTYLPLLRLYDALDIAAKGREQGDVGAHAVSAWVGRKSYSFFWRPWGVLYRTLNARKSWGGLLEMGCVLRSK